MSSPSLASSGCHQAGVTSLVTPRSRHIPPASSAPASPNCGTNSPCHGLTSMQGIPSSRETFQGFLSLSAAGCPCLPCL